MKKEFLLLLVLASLLAITLPNAFAVPVTFSGGNNSPVTMTLPQSVQYVITGNQASGPLDFVFVGMQMDPGSGLVPGGTITYSVNSGPSQSFNLIEDSGFLRDVSAVPVSIGQTVILSAGTLMTNGNISEIPVSGDYVTFIRTATGIPLSGPGTVVVPSVPDSLSTLWLALPLAGMLALVRFRRFGLVES